MLYSSFVMKIIVTNVDSVHKIIKNLDHSQKIGIISVLSKDSKFVLDSKFSTLHLKFVDIDLLSLDEETVAFITNSSWNEQLFTTQIAKQIKDFLNDKFDILIVHCEAGISRSPAIAAAISEFLNIPHNFFQTHLPNKMVFEILQNVLKNS